MYSFTNVSFKTNKKGREGTVRLSVFATEVQQAQSTERKRLTVIFCNSSFVGGAFLMDFAGFSWIGGGFIFRPSCGDWRQRKISMKISKLIPWDNPQSGYICYWIMYEYTTWPEPWAGFMIICGGSFCTCFLFKTKDCAGLRLIWGGEDGEVGISEHRNKARRHKMGFCAGFNQSVVPHQRWPSLSCQNVGPCPSTASEPWDFVYGWKLVNSGPAKRFDGVTMRTNNSDVQC